MIGRLFLFAAVLGIGGISPSVWAQEGVVLRYKFSKEDPAIYRTTTEMNQTMFFGGQKFENKLTQTEVNTLELVETTADRNLKLKHLNKRLTIKADMGPAGTYNFDSESSEREKGTALGSALNPVYETLSGVEYGITITPSGKVEELKGYKEVMETITKDNPLGSQFVGGGSDKAFKESLAETFIILDDQPLKKGDTWEVPVELELPKIGTAKGKRVYTFEGPITQDNPNVVRITMSMEMSFDLDVKSEGAEITGNIGTDSSKGSVRFDVEEGKVISSSVEYTLSGDLNLKVGDRNLKSSLKQTQKRSSQRLSALPK
ncbi:MAG: hypothetical protein KDA84_06105 [Planctomycetaceae bacterium]|nr:hypothetical protein [Planctomycetaceae bacterium]